MNDLIEKLKDKKYVRVFGLMTPKEREYLREVGKENLLVLYGLPHENGSVYWKENEHNPDNYPALTYAINPDYQPEPEFVDLEIFALDGWLMVQRDSNCEFLPYLQTHLHCLPSLPNFEGFYMPDPVITDGHEYLFIGTVARNIAKGKKVFARFRK